MQSCVSTFQPWGAARGMEESYEPNASVSDTPSLQLHTFGQSYRSTSSLASSSLHHLSDHDQSSLPLCWCQAAAAPQQRSVHQALNADALWQWSSPPLFCTNRTDGLPLLAYKKTWPWVERWGNAQQPPHCYLGAEGCPKGGEGVG